jgi:hypothetical protein
MSRVKVGHYGLSREHANDDTLTRLPPEILERIGAQIQDTRDIASLSRTSKRLKELMKNSLDKAHKAHKAHSAEKERIMNGYACKNWVNFDTLADVWKNDPDVVLRATENDWRALGVASERLRDDPDFMAKAVLRNGLGLQFATKRVKDNEDIVKLAMQNYKPDGQYHSNNPFQYASDRLQNTKKFVMDLIREDGYYCLMYASKQLRDDYDVMALAIESTFEKSNSEYEAMEPYYLASVRLKESHSEICPEHPHYYVYNDYVIEGETKRRVKAGIEDDQGNQIFPGPNAMPKQ